ncbi:MAG: formate-dependent phosphoribosylglycinamide formyltransferase [Candidatus Caenarcaniphilales bacterium]|nr:formate-dependent phosphoribosylglycinamide formyltransferase [Candidatus Caenarcaniphilales bacterium]
MQLPKKFLLLGSGELGKEFVIAAKRLGNYVIAVDKYPNAPAMQVSDEYEVISMLDEVALEKIIRKHNPDFIVPEVEAINTEKLMELEKEGFKVIPTASATNYTMNRDCIRELASKELGIRTARYAYAESAEELKKVALDIGFPNVVKPVMSSSGKGQSTAHSLEDLELAWNNAVKGARGNSTKVIIEEFIDFEIEITLLTVKQWNGETLFCEPIGHRQERGDYQESWQPAFEESDFRQDTLIKNAEAIAKKVTDRLGGAGVFGVEFFITKDEVVFSELSPRPHDTGMVTLISQNLSEFDLHLRAILGLPIPLIKQFGPSASAVVLASEDSKSFCFEILDNALSDGLTDLRIFGKPECRPHRRMGVALAQASSIEFARQKAARVSGMVNFQE